MRRFLALIAVLAVIVGGAVFAFRLIPPQDSPFEDLDLAHPVGMATGFKLDMLEHDLNQCFALLEQGGVAYTPIELDSETSACQVDRALTLDQSLVPYSATLSMSCPLSAALHVWERHVVLPAAEEALGSPVEEVLTYGSYNCRRVNGSGSGRWSEHASANAIDIAGFELADGRRITVLSDFGDDTPEGQFLEAIREGACGLFSATLGPDYNAAHEDHFHLDMGVFTICS